MARARRARFVLPLAVIALAGHQIERASSQTSEPVRVELSLADDRDVFRMGERIGLALTFTGTDPYRLETSRTWPGLDRIEVTPAEGAYVWLEEYSKYGTGSDSRTRSTISGSYTIRFDLNDWLRFDKPGDYTVRVTTRRLLDAGPATSTPVSVRILPLSPGEEAAEVARISTAIDAATDDTTRASLLADLSAIAGEHSTREQVRRLLADEEGGNLRASRHLELAIELLDAALDDPAVLPTRRWLSPLSSLRRWHEWLQQPSERPRPSFAESSERSLEFMREYSGRLDRSLASRSGRNRLQAAILAMQYAGRDGSVSDLARSVVLDGIESLPLYDRVVLIEAQWDHLRDPSLVPALERTLAELGDDPELWKRSAVLRCLMDIAPEAARPYVVSEILSDAPDVEADVLTLLPDDTLPDLDPMLLALLEQERAAGWDDEDLSAFRARMMSRYATAAIYPQVLAVYRGGASGLPVEARAWLLTYLSRWDPPGTLPLMRAAFEPDGDWRLLDRLTEHAYSPAIETIVIEELQRDDPDTVAIAASRLATRGSAAAEHALRRRLLQWEDRWLEPLRQAGSETETHEQAAVQVWLLRGLIQGQAWTLSAGEVTALVSNCVSDYCRRELGRYQ